MNAPSYRKILVVKYRGLGDSVLGLSSVQYLRELFPESHISYVVPSWVSPLFSNVKTSADEIVGMDLESPLGWLSAANYLRRRKFDLVYELFQSGRTAKLFSGLSSLMGFSYRFHNHHLKGGSEVIDQGVIKPVIQRDLDGVFSLLTDRSRRPDFIQYVPKMEISAEKENYFILGVVATRPTKSWPLDHFAKLVSLLVETYPEMGIKIPVSESKEDGIIASRLLKQGLPRNVEIVRVPLREIPAMIAKSHFYVGNDTGLKHVAVATGVRTLTFFGPELPLEWHPYDPKQHPYFFRGELSCRTEKQHYCDLLACDSMICLNQFTPEQVLSTLKENLS